MQKEYMVTCKKDGYLALSLAILKKYLQDNRPEKVYYSKSKLIQAIIGHFNLTLEDLRKMRKKR